MGSSAAMTSGLPPLPPGASLISGGGAGSGLPPLPPGATMIGGNAAASAPPDPNSANPKGEGLYNMVSPDGRQVQIPYSKIQAVAPQGYRFAAHGDLAQYARDYAADPVDEGRVDKFIDSLPWWGPAKMAIGLVKGIGTGAIKTAAGADRIVRGNGPLSRPEEMLQQAAETPASGAAEGVGEAAENAGEFFTGEEMLGLASKALPFAERLKQATGIAQALKNSPTLAKVVKIGMSAVRQGTIAGAQTFAKTGGDTGAAAEAGLGAAGAGAAIEGVAAPLARGAIGALAPKAAKGGEEFAQEARAAARGPLGVVSDAATGRDILKGADGKPMRLYHGTSEKFDQFAPTGGEPGFHFSSSPEVGSAYSGQQRTGANVRPAFVRSTNPRIYERGEDPWPDLKSEEGIQRLKNQGYDSAVVKEQNGQQHVVAFDPEQIISAFEPGKLKPFDVEQELAKYGDYTGVRSAMKENLNKVVPFKINAQFKTLSQQVDEAQAAYQADPTKYADYSNKQKELEDLIDKAGLTPEVRGAMKAGWTRYYALGDVTGAFDKAIDGIPGESGVSQQQRGINGNRLLSGLKNQVIKYGRSTVSNALGGEEHLKALEAIGNANKTNAARQAFNRGWHEVSRYLPLYLGYKAGEAVTGNFVGGAVGATAAAAGAAQLRAQGERVLAAVRSNPKIAQNLIFAVDSGANPKHYGPMIATMVQQYETEASRQRQADEAQQQEGDQR